MWSLDPQRPTDRQSSEPDSLRLGPGALHLTRPRVIPPHILTGTVAPLPQVWCDLWHVDLYVAHVSFPLVCVLMLFPATPKTAPLAFQPLALHCLIFAVWILTRCMQI